MSAKKAVEILTLTAVAMALILGPAAAAAENSDRSTLFAGCSAGEKPLRLHVLAASDEPYDQNVKLAVRDQIIDYLSPALACCSSKQEALAVIEDKLPLIEQVCNTCLERHGAAYRSCARLETADFPSIAYADSLFAAGDYDALRIVLGRGDGHNWWCVLFPPLCFVDLAAAADEEAVVAAWAEAEDDGEDLREHCHIGWKLEGLFGSR